MKTTAELELKMTEPSERLIEDMKKIDGDIMILGVGGKMGPTLAILAKRAIDAAGVQKRVIGVSRFSKGTLKERLEEHGVETIAVDLMKEEQLQNLPHTDNIIYMAGNKFGTTGNEHFTWAMNAYLPGRVAERFKDSRIVSFSTGNVYPLTPVRNSGASEDQPANPVGEYAQSCLGRERVFSYFSHIYNIPMVHFRLNYAIDLRYGVLVDVASSIKNQTPIDLSLGHANVIWQGDANEMAIRSLLVCNTPPEVINVTGPETVSIRWLAERLGERIGVNPIFENEEKETALLSNASKAHQLFGYPSVSLREMIEWTADWIKNGGETINKPTHFQQREGAF